MDDIAHAPGPRRNKGFDATHRAIIDTAVRLISEKGSEALSMASIAREMGINRTTLYYHYASREELLDAAKAWASDELAKGMDETLPTPERASRITAFVLDNPELIKLWIDDFISGGDIRQSYTKWDELVSGIAEHFARERPGEAIDAEVYCVMMLTSAIIGPRVYARSVDPSSTPAQVAERFTREQARILARDGLPVA